LRYWYSAWRHGASRQAIGNSNSGSGHWTSGRLAAGKFLLGGDGAA